MFNLFDLFLNYLFPPLCGFCGKLNKKFICNNCLNFINQISISTIDNYSNSKSYFSQHFYMFKYENDIRYKILQYKFLDNAHLYKTFAALFINDKNLCNFIQSYNCITCVPLSKKSFKRRGYNQSYLIAKELAKYFKIPFIPNLLIKENTVVAQSSLNRSERFDNIQNAFKFNNKLKNCLFEKKNCQSAPPPMTIAIFDDIFTTRRNC